MSEPQWLDERETRAWRGLVRLQTHLDAQLARDLQRDTGLSMTDYMVLVHLSEAPAGRLRAFQLGQALEWEKSRVSHHLRRMEGRRLLRREECESDARGAFVVLTPQGRKAIEQAAPVHLAHVRRYVVDVLSGEQLHQLAEVADTVLRNLAQLGDGHVREAVCRAEEAGTLSP